MSAHLPDYPAFLKSLGIPASAAAHAAWVYAWAVRAYAERPGYADRSERAWDAIDALSAATGRSVDAIARVMEMA